MMEVVERHSTEGAFLTPRVDYRHQQVLELGPFKTQVTSEEVTSSESKTDYDLKKRQIRRLFPDLFSKLTINPKNVSQVLKAIQAYLEGGFNARERYEDAQEDYEEAQEDTDITKYLPMKALLEFSVREKASKWLIIHAAACDVSGVDRALSEIWEGDGVWVNGADKRGHTALHKAVIGGSLDIVKLLLEEGVDINAIDERGHTVLHKAVTRGSLAIVKLLLENGADVSIIDDKCHTPLLRLVHNAVYGRGWDKRNMLTLWLPEVLPVLLKYKSDINAVNSRGWTSLRIATSGDKPVVADHLREHGALKI